MKKEYKKIVIAHRGASGYLPEHTLESKAMAYAMGADYLEQDIVLTKDNVAVVIHDVHLETVTNVSEKYPRKKRKDGKYYVIDFSYAELQTLSVYERFDLVNQETIFDNRFPFKKSLFKIHTLQEEIELIQGLNKSTGKNVGIYPEIKKPAFHRKEGKDISVIVLDILKEYGYTSKEDKCFVQCFDAEENKRIRFELKSNLKLIQLLGVNSVINFEEIAKYANGVGPWFETIITDKDSDENFIITEFTENAHNHNLLVHPYTFRADSFPVHFDSFEQLLDVAYLDANFDGIFTDFPDKAVNFLNSKTL